MRRILELLTVVLVCGGLAGAAAAGGSKNFRAHCKGRNEVPAVDSRGQCQALFRVTPDGGTLKYKLNAANIEGVTQAHIHLAAPDENGPVVAFLFGFVPEGVSPNGTLARGAITAADLIGPLQGATIADLVAELEAGNAYVNVHTQANAPGEIRGQVH